MARNLSSPPIMEPSPYSPVAALVNSFSSRMSTGSRRVTPSLGTPPLGSSDIDQVELQRLRAENQRNTRLLEDERRQASELHRRVAELQRDLDHIKVSTQRLVQIDIAIPKFVVMNGEGVILSPHEYFGLLNGKGASSVDVSSNASFGSSASYGGRNALSANSSRSSSPRNGGVSREPSPAADADILKSGKFFVAYLILVERGFPHPPGKTQVLRRFNDFRVLQKRIEKLFPQNPCLPNLPLKKPGALFSKQLNTFAELQQRRSFLEIFLRQLLCIQEVRQSEAIHKFLAGNVRDKVDLSEEALMMDDHDC
jgi:hypothetical protein